jgi:hypothetical protein
VDNRFGAIVFLESGCVRIDAGKTLFAFGFLATVLDQGLSARSVLGIRLYNRRRRRRGG